jgi:hypothetical protein
MKIELLVNLKLGNGVILGMGTIVSDQESPIPASIMKRVRLKQARIIDERVNPRFTTIEIPSSELDTTRESVTEEINKLSEVKASPKKILIRR